MLDEHTHTHKHAHTHTPTHPQTHTHTSTHTHTHTHTHTQTSVKSTSSVRMPWRDSVARKLDSTDVKNSTHCENRTKEEQTQVNYLKSHNMYIWSLLLAQLTPLRRCLLQLSIATCKCKDNVNSLLQRLSRGRLQVIKATLPIFPKIGRSSVFSVDRSQHQTKQRRWLL